MSQLFPNVSLEEEEPLEGTSPEDELPPEQRSEETAVEEVPRPGKQTESGHPENEKGSLPLTEPVLRTVTIEAVPDLSPRKDLLDSTTELQYYISKSEVTPASAKSGAKDRSSPTDDPALEKREASDKEAELEGARLPEKGTPGKKTVEETAGGSTGGGADAFKEVGNSEGPQGEGPLEKAAEGKANWAKTGKEVYPAEGSGKTSARGGSEASYDVPFIDRVPPERPNLSRKLGSYISKDVEEALEEAYLMLRRRFGHEASKSLLVESALRKALNDYMKNREESDLVLWLKDVLHE